MDKFNPQEVCSSSSSPSPVLEHISAKEEFMLAETSDVHEDDAMYATTSEQSTGLTRSEADSTHSDAGKDPICVVCGDKANGMHYKALTCEGCKTFFRRNARRRDNLSCEMDEQGRCEMDLYMRRHCAYCRMKKCLDVGMQVGRLWDKDRLKTRKPIKKTKSTREVPDEDVDELETSPDPLSRPELSPEKKQLMAMVLVAYNSSIDRNHEVLERPTQTIEEARREPSGVAQAILEGMNNAADDLVFGSYASEGGSLGLDRDITTMSMADIPSCSQQGSEQPARIFNLPFTAGQTQTRDMSEGKSDRTHNSSSDSEAAGGSSTEDFFTEAVYKHIMEVSLLVLRQMITFAKALSGFQQLQCVDQAALVKGTFVEYLVLTSGGIFDSKKKTFESLVMPGETYNMGDAKMSGFDHMFSQVLEFAEKMAKLDLTDEERAVLYAICVLTPDRPELSESAKSIISSNQEPLVDALCASGRINHPDQPQFFPKIVILLTELRNCTENFMDNIMQLKLKGNFIQPLLGEVFEM